MFNLILSGLFHLDIALFLLSWLLWFCLPFQPSEKSFLYLQRQNNHILYIIFSFLMKSQAFKLKILNKDYLSYWS